MCEGLLAEEIGEGLPITEVFLRVVDFKAEMTFPSHTPSSGRLARVVRALDAALRGLEEDHALGEGLGRAAL